MKKQRRIIVVLVASLAWLGGAAPLARAEPMTLQALLDGGSMVVGDKLFHNFSNFASTAVGALGVDPGQIWVIPSMEGGKFGLTFQSNGQFTVGAGQSQMTHIEFDVMSRGTLIKSTTLQMNGFAPGSGSTQISSIFGNGQQQLSVRASTPNNFAHSAFTGLHDRGRFSIDIRLTGGADGEGITTLDNFTFSVEQPEPGTMTLLGLGAAGLLGYRWRRSRQLGKPTAS
jgi:hypothetical protein